MPKILRLVDKFARENRPHTGPLWRLGLPLVITGYTSVLMQVTDALMVGQIGSEELAAVTPAGLIVSLLTVFGNETLTSVNSFASAAQGMKRPAEAGVYCWQGIYFCFVFGLMCLAYYPTAGFVFKLLLPSISDTVLNLEVTYFQTCLFSVLPTVLSSTLGYFFISCHKPGVPMAAALGTVVLNALLNGGLIFGWGPFPQLGFIGAAWGTAISSMVQAVFLMGYLLLSKSFRPMGSLNAKFYFSKLKRLLKVGLPSGVQGCLDLLSWGVLISWLIGHFDYKHLAAQTILTACIRFSFVPADGIASGLATLVGHAQGERNFLLAKRFTRTAFRMIATYMTIMAVMYYLARYWIMGWFTDDLEVIEYGARCMVFVSAFQYFDAMNLTHINALQGAGDTAWPTAMQLILSAGVLMGGGLLVINYKPEWQSSGVWFVAAVYVAMQGIVFRMRWAKGRWRRITLIEEEPEIA